MTAPIRPFLLMLSCLSMSIAVPLAHTQDWPHWLGPYRNGVASTETTIRTTFEKQLTPAWQVSLGNRHISRRDGGCPVVVNGVVYLFHMVEKNREVERWRLKFDKKWKRAKSHDGLSADSFTKLKSLPKDQGSWPNRKAFDTWLQGQGFSDADQSYIKDKMADNTEAYRQNYLSAYKLDDGSSIWQIDWAGDMNKGWFGGEVHMTPAVADGVIYLVESDGTTHARSTTDGASIWQSSEKVWGTYAGANSSPVVHKGIVYLSRETGQIALSAKDGSLVWASETIEPFRTMDNSNAILALADGTELLLAPSTFSGKKNHELFAMNLQDGSITWRIDKGGSRYMTPVIAGNRLVTVQSDATNKARPGLYVYDLTASPPSLVFNFPETAEQLKAIKGSQTCNTAIAHGDRCWWSTSKGLFCFSLTDGKMLWKNTEHGIGDFATNILCGDVIIAMVINKGWGIFDANTGATIHIQNINRRKWHPIQSPVLADGRLLYRSKDTGLVCYDLRP